MFKNNNTSQGGKYKTTMCKHYNTLKGCSYGEKCQFAHGDPELRGFTQGNNFSNNTMGSSPNMSGMSGMSGMGMNMNPNYSSKGDNSQTQKKVPNPSNFKIVKCKNFDRDGQCKYGNTCTFAHGETELRSKVENTMMYPNNSQSMGGNQFGFNPYMMDPNMLMYMNSMGYPNADMSQMNMFGMQNMDPNLNLNGTNATTPSTGTSYNEMNMNNANNMGFYPLYPNQGTNSDNN